MTAVVDITVVSGNPPAGYSIIPVNLNSGTGSKSANLYFAIAYGPIQIDTNYMCGVALISGSVSSLTVPEGYDKYPVDLNAGAGGNYIYLARQYLKNRPPIVGFKVTASLNQGDAMLSPGTGYVMLPVDMNAGAGGNYIYAWYKKMSDAEYCALTTTLGTPYCANYCTNGKCDTAMTTYCKTSKGLTDPRCSCINSAASDPSIGINPKCIDSKCLSTGYLTTNMIQTNCPNIINCNQQVSINNAGLQLRSDVNVSSDCNENKQEDVPADTSSEITGTMIIIMILVILIACGLAYLYFEPDDIVFEQIN